MKATYLPDLLTPLDFWEAHSAIDDALRRVTGSLQPDLVVALSMSQSALETYRWKLIHRYNFKNAKAGEKYEGFFTCFRCNEVLKGKVERFDPTTDGYQLPPGHPQTRFRAFQSASDGATNSIALLQSRWPAAFTALLAGDATAFVRALKAGNYFTADEAPYLKGVASLQREFLARLAMKSLPDTPETVLREACACINDEDRARIEWLWHDTMTAIFDEARADARAHILGGEEP